MVDSHYILEGNTMQEYFHPTFTITMKDGGVMTGELYP